MEIPQHPLAGSVTNTYMVNEDGTVKVPALVVGEEIFKETKAALDDYKWRDEDFLLATFPKNGTHFMWEIMMMLLRGSADYIKGSKAICMMDLVPVSKADMVFPSPRVLNTHYRLDVLPAELRNKKTVIVMRNPKDTCVSYHHHETVLMASGESSKDFVVKDITFSDYIKMFLYNKDVPYGSYFDYIEYMWSLRNNPNILIVFFEDLKLDPVSTIQKVNEFMGTDRSPDLVQQIAMATSFSKMKDGKTNSHNSELLQELVQTKPEEMENSMKLFFRKGEVGDWKRHLTVADNELFDSFLQNWKVGQEIPFKSV